MINIPKNYDFIQAYDGSFRRVTPGGHVCRIIGARPEEVTLRNGSVMRKLTLLIDIDEGGELDGMFSAQYESDKRQNSNAKWRGRFDQPIEDKDGNCSPHFKGLIKSIEESNEGYKGAWDERTLKQKKLGLIFREEEYINTYGELKTAVRPFAARSVQTILKGVPVPEKKVLNLPNVQQRASAPVPQGFEQVYDSDLPF